MQISAIEIYSTYYVYQSNNYNNLYFIPYIVCKQEICVRFEKEKNKKASVEILLEKNDNIGVDGDVIPPSVLKKITE